jgi:hypothetical protein
MPILECQRARDWQVYMLDIYLYMCISPPVRGFSCILSPVHVTIYCGLWPPGNTTCLFLTWYQSHRLLFSQPQPPPAPASCRRVRPPPPPFPRHRRAPSGLVLVNPPAVTVSGRASSRASSSIRAARIRPRSAPGRSPRGPVPAPGPPSRQGSVPAPGRSPRSGPALPSCWSRAAPFWQGIGSRPRLLRSGRLLLLLRSLLPG